MLFMAELCSCRSTGTLTQTSHDTIQRVSIIRDSVILRDSVVIRYDRRNDTVFVTKQEFHDKRLVSAINNSEKQCRTDTLKSVDIKPEPKARSTLRLFEKGGIKTRIRGFLIVVGLILICLVTRKINRI